MLIIQNNTLQKMLSHAQDVYPRECCGILLGISAGCRRTACRILHTENMAADALHFAIDPLSVAQAEALAEEEGLEIIGFYHSHPDHAAVASAADVCHMLAGFSYPIVSVQNGRCAGISSFTKRRQTDDHAMTEDIFNREKYNADCSIHIRNTAGFR